MRITTMERLDRVPVGQQVYVDTEVWRRTEEGLSLNGTTLPLIAFRAFAEDGKLRDTEGIAPGDLPQWRHIGAVDYLVVGEEPSTDGYMTVSFNRGAYTGVETYPHDTIINMQQGPGGYGIDHDQLIVAFREFNRRYMPIDFLGGGEAKATGGLIDALHVYAADHPDLDEVLVEHHVGRKRSGEVTVEARGRSRVTADQFGGVEVDGEPEVGWKFTYNYSATTPVTEPCLCSTFNEEFFRLRLPVNTTSEEHRFTCSETDCVNKVAA